jgi:serine O-acetyltransferase
MPEHYVDRHQKTEFAGRMMTTQEPSRSDLITSLNARGLCALMAAQTSAFFPDGDALLADELQPTAERALERLVHCFTKVNNRYFFDGEHARFDHLHGDQYAMWLYMASRQLFLDGGPPAWCKKLFLLNKALHGCDIYFEVELPSVFLLVHPLGTVLGRGRYEDYLMVYQRCGVGSNHGVYPSLGRHLTLRPGAAVLGNCTVGDNVTVAAESLVLDRDLPPNTTYIGSPKDHRQLPRPGIETLWRT